MNMKRKKPLPQPKVKVDLTQAETLKCEKCGISAPAVKHLSDQEAW